MGKETRELVIKKAKRSYALVIWKLKSMYIF